MKHTVYVEIAVEVELEYSKAQKETRWEPGFEAEAEAWVANWGPVHAAVEAELDKINWLDVVDQEMASRDEERADYEYERRKEEGMI